MTHSDASYGDILTLAAAKCQLTDERGHFSALLDVFASGEGGRFRTGSKPAEPYVTCWPFVRTPSVHYTVISYPHRGALLCGAGEATVAVRELQLHRCEKPLFGSVQLRVNRVRNAAGRKNL